MSESALVELRDVLVELVRADSGLDQLLQGKKAFRSQAPSGAALNYVVVGQVLTDTDASYINGQSGRQHRSRVSMWARSPRAAELIYARLTALLDQQVLAVDGHTMQTAAFDVVAGPLEDEDRKAWGLHADWTVKTVEAP